MYVTDTIQCMVTVFLWDQLYMFGTLVQEVCSRSRKCWWRTIWPCSQQSAAGSIIFLSGIHKLVDRWDNCLNEYGRYAETVQNRAVHDVNLNHKKQTTYSQITPSLAFAADIVSQTGLDAVSTTTKVPGCSWDTANHTYLFTASNEVCFCCLFLFWCTTYVWSLRTQGRLQGVESCKIVCLEGMLYSRVQTLLYRLATMHTITDRQTDDIIMPTVNPAVCSTSWTTV